MKKNNSKIQAFSIVETLVTLLAITLMISAPLAFMVRSHNYSEIVRSKIVSTGLAQEGLELVTSLRNQNLANFQTLSSNCSATTNGGCMVDWDGISDTPTVTACTDNACRLYSNSADSGQMFRSSGDTETEYYRYVTLQQNGTQSYNAESVAYAYVNGVKVEVRLQKVITNIDIK